MIKKGRTSVIKYALLPGLWPRAHDLFASGFRHLPYLMANLFFMLRLLPENHSFFQPGHYGSYSMLSVLREAGQRLEFHWKYIDRILAYFAVLGGLFMLVIQFLLMVVAVIVAPANAQNMPTSYEGFFTTPYPKEDIAFRMLDLVFGIPGLFALEEGGAKPFHVALQAMLQFYSLGLLVIGFFILIYIVIVIVAETAESGVPFGKRFNKTWAPIRLVLFLGLLIPISNGLNGAQYIVFLAAKGGSGLATNGWKVFHETISDTYLGNRETLVATPQPPNIISIPAFIMLAKTCQKAVGFKQHKDVKAWVIIGTQAEEFSSKTFASITADMARANTNRFDVKVRFGEQNDTNRNFVGNISPDCGELQFYTTDISEPGAAVVQQAYYDLVQSLWNESGAAGGQPGGPGGAVNATAAQRMGDDMQKYATAYYRRYVHNRTDASLPPPEFKKNWSDLLLNYMSGRPYKIGTKEYGRDETGGVIGEAVQVQVTDGDFEVSEEIIHMGWAAASIWYNKIAQQNGALVAAVQSFPTPSLYPSVMEYVATQRSASSVFSVGSERYNPSLPDGTVIQMQAVGDDVIINVLNKVYTYWTNPDVNTDADAGYDPLSGNFIVDTINLFLGTSGLFDMCKNADIHPLAQLSATGKAMIESSIRGFATGAIMGVAGGFLSILSGTWGEAGYAAAGFLTTFAGIGLMLGFILFYLVPFFPFMYFFFAVGDWLKGIFEAIIGAPLWALGHLRIDSEGMVGDAAEAGYYMVFEIFLRPILILFGLLASLIVFSAMVKVLNDIFYLVLANLPAGPDAEFCFTNVEDGYSYVREPIDQFFYTVVYAIVVYMIGMSSFKLIDIIPKSVISRWLGEDVSAFGDQSDDPAEGLIQRVAMSGAGIGQRLESGLGSAAKQLRGMGPGIQQLWQGMQR